jgi:hypothetical protein
MRCDASVSVRTGATMRRLKNQLTSKAARTDAVTAYPSDWNMLARKFSNNVLPNP